MEVEAGRLHDFLLRFYPPAKCEFLQTHGDWWYGDRENRWVLLMGDEIAGYCAGISTRILADQQVIPAIWWVDLLIAPQFRGLGLQSHFDRKIQELNTLKLGFPNARAAAIHSRHGWNVRDDLQVRLLPLFPFHMNQVWHARGWRRVFMKSAAFLISPWTWVMRQKFEGYMPRSAYQVHEPSSDELAAVFERAARAVSGTTYRDSEYFQRRFLNAPYRHELAFYAAGRKEAPSHFLIARYIKRGHGLVTRILDLFGDFEHEECLKDIILHLLRDAANKGSSQVTVLISRPGLQKLLVKLGFLFSRRVRFCWMGDPVHTAVLSSENVHWTLSDSDNDEMI